MNDLIKFIQARNLEFEIEGIEFGEVKFKCPICSGQAWAIRKHTPENIAHEVTVRSGCEKCGTLTMN